VDSIFYVEVRFSLHKGVGWTEAAKGSIGSKLTQVFDVTWSDECVDDGCEYDNYGKRHCGLSK
jgi:hypothetical protein